MTAGASSFVHDSSMRKCALQTTVQCTRQIAADGDMPTSVGVIRTSGGHPTGPRAVAISSSPARIICASCRPSMHRQVEAASRKSGDLVLDPLLPTRSHANSDIASLCAGALPPARARVPTPFAPAVGGSSSRTRHQQVEDTTRHDASALFWVYKRDDLGSRLPADFVWCTVSKWYLRSTLLSCVSLHR